MTKQEREENPSESFDGGFHLLAKEKHAERVAKNADRVQYAIAQLESNGIEYTLKNPVIGHFHCRRKSDDRLVQFWAGTGKIYDPKSHFGDTERGIHRLIDYLTKF